MIRSSMVALYELFMMVLGRDKLTPAVAELLLLLTSKAEVIKMRWLENGRLKEKTSRCLCGGWLQCRRCEQAARTQPLTPWLLGSASSGQIWWESSFISAEGCFYGNCSIVRFLNTLLLKPRMQNKAALHCTSVSTRSLPLVNIANIAIGNINTSIVKIANKVPSWKVWEDRVDARRSDLEASGIWSSGQLAITVQLHKKSNLKTLLPSGAPLTLR